MNELDLFISSLPDSTTDYLNSIDLKRREGAVIAGLL